MKESPVRDWQKHFREKSTDFSVQKMRRNKELEKKYDSENSHFALAGLHIGKLSGEGKDNQ